MKNNLRLSRYTTLPVVLDLLERKRLVLLSPEKWEDRNDAEIMIEYKKRKELRHLYAICFGQGDETVHHWNAFAGGPSGCCIEFDYDHLLAQLHEGEGLRYGRIKYRKVKHVSPGDIELEKMPFIKRWPYRCEAEFRIIYESKRHSGSDEFYEIPINLKCINRITVNQRMPDQVYETIKGLLKGVLSNPAQRVYHSTLYANRQWIAKFKTA